MAFGKMKMDAMFPSSITFAQAVVVIGYLLIIPSMAELDRFQHPTKADGSLSFLVVGDWGRKGNYNQSEVAVQVPFLTSYIQFFGDFFFFYYF